LDMRENGVESGEREAFRADLERVYGELVRREWRSVYGDTWWAMGADGQWVQVGAGAESRDDEADGEEE
jgi:hypothetical protein